MLDFLSAVSSLPYPERPAGVPDTLYRLLLHPAFPLSFIVIYNSLVGYVNRHPFSPSSSRVPRGVVIAHNVLLASYSAVTFGNALAVVLAHFRRAGREGRFREGWCDVGGSMLVDLGQWSWWFYVSKYYEIVDTAIILLKGKRASVLQEYHHSGAILTMWFAYRYASTPCWAFVVFNSFIHMIMYTYYSLTTLRVPVPVAFKRSLTTAQISQFILGAGTAISYTVLSLPLPDVRAGVQECLDDAGQRLAVWVNLAYLTPLTVLFTRFWIKSYGKKSRARGEKRGKTSAQGEHPPAGAPVVKMG